MIQVSDRGNLITGCYVQLTELPDRNLKIILTDDGREFLREHLYTRRAHVSPGCKWDVQAEQCSRCHPPTNSGKPHSSILSELLEDITCNSDFELLDEYSDDYLRVGALTSSPIIAYDVARDDSTNELIDADKIWWFPDYQVTSELETLLDESEVIFTNGIT